MPRTTDRPQNLEDVKAWIAEHDGRIDAYWKAQHRLNDRTEARFAAFGLRLEAVERRVLWISGAAATLGGVLGGLLPKVWTG